MNAQDMTAGINPIGAVKPSARSTWLRWLAVLWLMATVVHAGMLIRETYSRHDRAGLATILWPD